MGQCLACDDVNQVNQQFILNPHEINLEQVKEQKTSEQEKVQILEKDKLMEEILKKEMEQERQQLEWLKEEQVKLKLQEKQKDEHLDYHKFIHLFQISMHYYKGHDIQSAFEAITQLQEMKSQIKAKRSLQDDQFIVQLRETQVQWQKINPDHKIEHYNIETIKMIEKQLKDMQYYYSQLTKAPFVQKYYEDGVKISTRKQEGSIGALVECQLNMPFQYIAAVLNQIQYFTEVVPYCESSRVVKDCARNSKVGYAVINMPFVTRRQAYFQGLAYFRSKEQKQLFLYTRSIHDKPELQKAYNVQTPINPDYVQMDYKYFMIKYEPIKEGVGNFTFAFNIDNRINFLPNFIEDYLVRDFGRIFFQKIIKIGKNFKGSKWEASVREKPELFEFVKLRIKEMLQIKSAKNIQGK